MKAFHPTETCFYRRDILCMCLELVDEQYPVVQQSNETPNHVHVKIYAVLYFMKTVLLFFRTAIIM